MFSPIWFTNHVHDYFSVCAVEKEKIAYSSFKKSLIQMSRLVKLSDEFVITLAQKVRNVTRPTYTMQLLPSG